MATLLAYGFGSLVYGPMLWEANFWHNVDRLDGILIGIAGTRAELASQLIWTCSWTDRLEAIQKRVEEIDEALDSSARLD
jgi:hypothetical protein